MHQLSKRMNELALTGGLHLDPKHGDTLLLWTWSLPPPPESPEFHKKDCTRLRVWVIQQPCTEISWGPGGLRGGGPKSLQTGCQSASGIVRNPEWEGNGGITSAHGHGELLPVSPLCI